MVCEGLWRWLRAHRLLRRMYGSKGLGALMRWASNHLVPANRDSLVRVRSGLGEGLVFRVYPRWEWPVWEGTYELEVQSVLKRVLHPGAVFYDVGGGMGFFTCCAARIGARVFVFEPDQTNADCLEHHLRMNALTERVIVERKAVFSHGGTVRLLAPLLRHSHGNAVVSEGGAVVAMSTTLDDYASVHAFPDICKVDVEGTESEVLKGAERLFESHRPAVILEVHDKANALFAESYFARKAYTLQWLSDRQEFPKHFFALPNR